MTEQEGIEVLTTLKGTGAVTGEEIDAIDAVDEAMFVLEQYREIGTVEECRASVEKQTAKKPNYDDYHRAGYRCPTCNNVNPWGYKHCKHCGQKLDWREEE